MKLPLVCRLTGTNADKANKMIEEYTKKNPKFKITAASDLDDAAVKAVAKSKGQWLVMLFENVFNSNFIFCRILIY